MRRLNGVFFAALLVAFAALLQGCNMAAIGHTESAASGREQRTVVFEVYGIPFMNPYDTRKVATGDTIKVAADHSNLFLERYDGKIVPIVSSKEADAYRSEPQALAAEQQSALTWFSNARPVDEGRHIVFNSNKLSVLNGTGGTVSSIHMIAADGSKEKLLLDGEAYGSLTILDTVGSRVYAQGVRDSLLVMDTGSHEIKRFPIAGRVDAVSADGEYVLFRKVKDGYVLPELYVFNLSTAETRPAGRMPDDYFFSQ